MTQETIKVGAMSCGHCVETITNALSKADGVNKVSVNLEEKNVSVDFDESKVNLKEISEYIIAAGFEVN